MAEQALSDVKVLSLGQGIPGPFAAKMLADYGADVIKIEPPKGDPARKLGPFFHDEPHPEKSGLFLYLNLNKRGITLNLKSQTGQKVFKQLIKDVDILLENFMPDVLPSVGLDYETLEKINPKLVMVSVTYFGQTGPYRNYKGSEIILEGMGHAMHSQGLPEREPSKIALNALLFQSGCLGAMAAMTGFMVSRYQGIGQYIDLSMMEAQLFSPDRRGAMLIGYQYTGMTQPRIPATAEKGLMDRVFPCKDGWFFAPGGNIRYWDKFVKAVGEPEIFNDPKWMEFFSSGSRVDNPEAEALKMEFDAWFFPWVLDRTKAELWPLFQKHGLISGPSNTIEDVFHAPNLKERNFWIDVDHPYTGKVSYAGRPFIMSDTPWQFKMRAPLLGEHNEEVYGQLGYSKEDLVLLRQRGVI